MHYFQMQEKLLNWISSKSWINEIFCSNTGAIILKCVEWLGSRWSFAHCQSSGFNCSGVSVLEASSFQLVGVWLPTGTTQDGVRPLYLQGTGYCAVLLLCDWFIVSTVTGFPVQQLVLVSTSSHFLIINSWASLLGLWGGLGD